jgi:hypothetical protein
MEGVRSSETSVHIRTTQGCITEYDNIHKINLSWPRSLRNASLVAKYLHVSRRSLMFQKVMIAVYVEIHVWLTIFAFLHTMLSLIMERVSH